MTQYFTFLSFVSMAFPHSSKDILSEMLKIQRLFQMDSRDIFGISHTMVKRVGGNRLIGIPQFWLNFCIFLLIKIFSGIFCTTRTQKGR